jgi:hypothetical protein
MIKVLDFVLVCVMLYLVQVWSDGVGAHKWTLFVGVMIVNLVGFFRGRSK